MNRNYLIAINISIRIEKRKKIQKSTPGETLTIDHHQHMRINLKKKKKKRNKEEKLRFGLMLCYERNLIRLIKCV